MRILGLSVLCALPGGRQVRFRLGKLHAQVVAPIVGEVVIDVGSVPRRVGK